MSITTERKSELVTKYGEDENDTGAAAGHQGGIHYQTIAPATIFMDNMLMGINTMEAARTAGAKKYVNVLASCSYPGYGEADVLREDEYWDGPLHDSVVNYGITKKVQSVQADVYQQQYNFTTIGLIPTNLYGPREHFHPDRSHALAALIRKFYEAKRDGVPEVVVWGTGKPVREWMYVDDAATAIVKAAEVANETTILNVGMGTGYTITELAETIREVLGYTGEIVYDTTKQDGAARKVMRTSRMNRMLGDLPRMPLEERIKKTLDWLIDNYDKVTAEPVAN
ncbi:MAG: NAD-dependent epimerase/dehydratase family protein [Proteobacteria bacterium]|nr:NAD-dependent epimerase/dehydratase family protein [Pseudomonadota bacterium]